MQIIDLEEKAQKEADINRLEAQLRRKEKVLE